MRRAVSAPAAALVAAAALAGPAPAAAAPAGARVLFRFADPRLDEASGIAAGLRSPGVVYAQNDSGDAPRFFAVDRRTGTTAAVVTVAGARNVDWEDIAVARDVAGTPSVWLADIGDNDARRHTVTVYRVAEPAVAAGDHDRAITTAPAQVWRLRYPDGPVDAESLAVAPGGVGYIVTKSPLGSSQVLQLPRSAHHGRVQVLHRIGNISFAPTDTANPFGIIGTLAATSASLSADGRLLAVRTYADADLWPVGAGGVGAAIRRPPVVVPLPRQRQGEGIAISGDRLLLDSEGRHTPVWSVPVPAGVLPSVTPSRPAPSGPAPSPAARSTPGTVATGSSPAGSALLAAAAVAAGAVVLAGFGWWLTRRAGARP